jgi:hypothetical protein
VSLELGQTDRFHAAVHSHEFIDFVLDDASVISSPPCFR